MLRSTSSLSILVGLLGLSIFALTQEQQPQATSSPIPLVRKPSKAISAPGEVRIKGKTTIVPTPDSLTRTLIKPGDTVEAGQVIFLLANYHPEIAKLQASMESFTPKQDWQKLSRQVATSQIRSPITGQVLRLEPVVEIGNLEDVQVIAHLTPDQVKIGQTVAILCDQREILGRVIQVQTDHVLLQLNEPLLALTLLNQPFKVKVIDNLSAVSYN